MDNIANLSSNLPPTGPVDEHTMQKINSELSAEFKNAAKSVASLYKLSLQKNSQLKHQGYLDCINDLLNLIKNSGDVENWALMKKLELEGKLINNENAANPIDAINESKNPSSSEAEEDEEERSISLAEKLSRMSGPVSTDYEFDMGTTTQRKFPPSMPILSVDRSSRRKTQHNVFKPHDSEPQADGLISHEPTDDDIIIEEDGTKRRLESLRVEKRPKL